MSIIARRSDNFFVRLKHPDLAVLLVEEDIRSLRPLIFGNGAHAGFIRVEQANAMNGAEREEQPGAHDDVRAMQQARK